jgi:hypothetical protein
LRTHLVSKGLKFILLLVAITAAAWAQFQQAPGTQAQSAEIRVTAPQQHARQTANYVTLRYELQNPTSATAGSPNFKVQLDGNDPVVTASTEQNFTGLTPGQHVVTIQLVDANGTPIPNSQTQVQFVVLPTPQNAGGQNQGAGTSQPSAPLPQASLGSIAVGAPQVQMASYAPQGSLLPIVSIVGFGVLVGGIVSAIKTHN